MITETSDKHFICHEEVTILKMYNVNFYYYTYNITKEIVTYCIDTYDFNTNKQTKTNLDLSK